MTINGLQLKKLETILQEEYQVLLTPQELNEFATNLVHYFSILERNKTSDVRFESSPLNLIDSNKKSDENDR